MLTHSMLHPTYQDSWHTDQHAIPTGSDTHRQVMLVRPDHSQAISLYIRDKRDLVNSPISNAGISTESPPTVTIYFLY